MDSDSYKNSVFYYQVGNDYLDKGHISEAIVNFNRSCDLYEHFKTHERLYSCYCMLGETEKAHKHIEYAHELNSRNDKTAYLYSKSLISKGNTEKGKKILQEILFRNPSYKKALEEIEKLRDEE